MAKPNASILIPAHNAERWVAAAVESALSQTVNCEVIVVDDGSSDGTLDILRAFENRITLETGPNRGGPSARNRLLELARADWVQYLDADDYLLPDKVAQQLDQANRDADVLYGPEIIEWHRGSTVHQTQEPIASSLDPWALLAAWDLPQTGAPLWRKQAILDVGGWRLDQPCCQEHELYLRMLIAGKSFVYSGPSGAVYRRFEDGTVSTRDPSLVRKERGKIEDRIEHHLRSINALTTLRQQAIDQARFEMARSAWPVDQNEAYNHHASISSDRFKPDGTAAPELYRLVYMLLGFGAAERIALFKRSVMGS